MKALSLLLEASLRHRAVVLFGTVLFVLFGLSQALLLPVDAVPDITNIQVQVITSAPALSPVEVEQYVTVPVERAMAGIPRMAELRSISKYGISVVTVAFEDGTDIYFARQLVGERLREAEDRVPKAYGRPELGPISSGLGEIFQFTVRNEQLTLMQLEELLDWHIGPLLRSVPGVVEVNSLGGEDKQYQVELDPRRLQAFGISAAEVIEALEKSNANAGGGYIEHNREHFVIGSDGLVKDIEDLRRVVIGATGDGVPVTVENVGEVRLGARLRKGAASQDGQGEVVVGVALMLMGENSRTVTDAVAAKLVEIQPSLPAGTKIEPFYDRSVLVSRTMGTVGKNLAEGALLVIGVLFLLLGDLRAGLIVALVIPLSLLFAVTLMKALGLSGNLMSLGAIDFGLMVDGAVIIVENAVRCLGTARAESGRPLSAGERLVVVRDAAMEVRSASVFGEMIIAIVYLPILALSGIEGKLFRPMATTVLLALLGAFVFSLTLVPVLASLWLKPRAEAHETWLFKLAKRGFGPSLDWAFGRRFAVLTGAFVVLLGGGAMLSRLGAEFVPTLDEGDVLVEARRLPGIALSESVAMDLRMEKALLEIPEVAHVVAKTGAPELATDPMGLEASDVYIQLRDTETWRKGLVKEDLAREISAKLEEAVPEVAGGVSQPIQMRTNELVAGVRSDVALLLYGPDLEALKRYGDQAAAVFREIPGASDVRVEQMLGLLYLRIVPDRGKLSRHGLSIEDVNQVTETLAVGHGVGEVMEGERRFGIVVKMKHGYAGDLDVLKALPLKSVTGQMIPLGEVAALRFVGGPAAISREGQSRRLSVELNVRGRDLLSVVKDAQAAFAKQVTLPVGYRAVWGGQFQHYQEAKTRLVIAVPMALSLILFLLWLAFQSVRASLLILLNVPFAVTGGVFALWARSIPFSVSAGVGFIALFGVAVLNGLVLISFAWQLEERGAPPGDAIREAAKRRLLPVLMTALVASLGFVPMAIATGPGSEVQRPLATVVIGGLFSSTLLTLYVLPVVYAIFGGGRRRDDSRAEEGASVAQNPVRPRMQM